MYLLTYTAQGGTEEVVARGLLLHGGSWWIGLIPAVAVQASFFLAIHLANPNMTAAYGLFVLVFAMLLWRRRKTAAAVHSA